MALKKITLINKIALTGDVFELHYESEDELTMLPGQFISFILPKIGGRAYSILEISGTTLKLIIKRWSLDAGGRGGSILLCDATIGDSFNFVGPAGHFVLQGNHKNKLFLGTGTGLVPLYNQILEGLKKGGNEKYQLVFGVRTQKDMFYQANFESLKEAYPDRFYYHLVTSRSESEGIVKKGYVTDFLSSKVVSQYGEYYICGAPAMIDSCKEKLSDLGVGEENIFFEKYA